MEFVFFGSGWPLRMGQQCAGVAVNSRFRVGGLVQNVGRTLDPSLAWVPPPLASCIDYRISLLAFFHAFVLSRLCSESTNFHRVGCERTTGVPVFCFVNTTGGLKPGIPKPILKRPLIDPPIRDLPRRNIALASFFLGPPVHWSAGLGPSRVTASSLPAWRPRVLHHGGSTTQAHPRDGCCLCTGEQAFAAAIASPPAVVDAFGGTSLSWLGSIFDGGSYLRVCR